MPRSSTAQMWNQVEWSPTLKLKAGCFVKHDIELCKHPWEFLEALQILAIQSFDMDFVMW
mgnify:FL=1